MQDFGIISHELARICFIADTLGTSFTDCTEEYSHKFDVDGLDKKIKG